MAATKATALRQTVAKALDTLRNPAESRDGAIELLEQALADAAPVTRPKLGPIKVDYTREELIAICEAAIVPMKHWYDRDSASAQRQVGDCWVLLRADVPFRIEKDTDHRTIWVEHYDIEGFQYVELGKDFKETELSYLPTPKRLEEAAGKDWY